MIYLDYPIFICLLHIVHCRDQSVGVKGTLYCRDEPLQGATIKLWELDTWPDPDDLLATVTTDKDGHFEISGSENEILSITPVLKIYHRCNNKGFFNLLPNICKRKIVYEIPSKYINSGKNVDKWYEMGIINMEGKERGEDTECLPSFLG